MYDIFKSVRTVRRHSRTAVFAEDIIYSVIITFLTFCLCILRTNGQPRSFLILGIALGFSIIRYILSKPLVFAFSAVLRFLIKIKTIVFKVLGSTFCKIGAKIAEILKKFAKTLKKGLKGVKRLLYNLFNKISDTNKKVDIN